MGLKAVLPAQIGATSPGKTIGRGVVVIPDALWPEVERRAWDVLANEARIRIMAAQGRPVEQILADCGAF